MQYLNSMESSNLNYRHITELIIREKLKNFLTNLLYVYMHTYKVTTNGMDCLKAINIDSVSH